MTSPWTLFGFLRFLQFLVALELFFVIHERENEWVFEFQNAV